MHIFGRALRDRRTALLWWTLGIAIYCAFIVAVWPVIDGNDEFQDLYDEMPDTLQAMFGSDGFSDFTSPAGFLNTYLFSMILPFIFTGLAWNRHLHLAVRNHAAYLVAVGHLGHAQEAPEFATIQKRAHSFGYSGPVWENCHHGSETAEGALIAWTHSSAHHRTILTAKLTEMATGFAEKTWVQKFGLDTAFESDIQYHPWRD